MMMTKSLNDIKCKNSQCDFKGSFDVKKVSWYWPVAFCGLFFWPLFLLFILNTNEATCPECGIKSDTKPMIKEPKTGDSKLYRAVIWFFLAFVGFIFYLALRG